MCDYDQPNFTLYAIYYCPIPTLVIHSHPTLYLPLSTARCHILYSFCSRDAQVYKYHKQTKKTRKRNQDAQGLLIATDMRA